MTELELWLKRATRCLSSNSAAQVRMEIQDHFQSARDAAISGGVTAAEADRLALAALGDAKVANRQYRKVLLTSAEARLLREGNWEARAICSNRFVKRLFFSVPVAVLVTGIALLLIGASGAARTLLLGGIGLAVLFVAPLLPVYTPSRSRALRYVKWAVLTGMLLLAFRGSALKFSWLLFSCMWPVAWIEWQRASIRRKLPVAQWPKQLYL